MDYEEQKRRQSIRVIIAEIGMVLSVIAIVVVATLVAMGFFITSDGQIEQSGLLQLHSVPTGATVTIDGETIFNRTNLSRTVAAGEHTVRLTRDGYDAWEKTLDIEAGMLRRVYYPRLFLEKREAEEALELARPVDELAFYAPSRSRNYILYAFSGSTEWQMVDIRGDELKTTKLDLSGVLPGVTKEKNAEAVKFGGVIEELKWSGNDEKVLVRVRTADKVSWVLVNLADVTKSMNLTQTFGLAFEQVEVIDEGANRLFALENGHLRRIDTGAGSLSKVLLADVVSFRQNGTNVIYLEQKDGARKVGVYRDGEDGGTTVATIESEAPVKIALSRYYDEDYICYSVGQELTVKYGTLPSYRKNGYDDLELKVLNHEYEAPPLALTVSPDGQYVVAQGVERRLMVLDLEVEKMHNYTGHAETLRWLDASMMYAVEEAKAYVWDFDGTNERVISKAGVEKQALVITSNNRWLYYLSLNTQSGKSVLIRERILN